MLMHPVRMEINRLLGFEPMNHRPPLPRRWWLYCVVAYLAPPILLQLIPTADVSYRDLVWLVTLVPAFVLSLQFGVYGAAAGLFMGTTLFVAVQFIDSLDLEPGDWRITTPIYIAYSAIAISVGWLSQQLHRYYAQAIQGERVSAVAQLAVAVQHEVRNALATIHAETALLESAKRPLDEEERMALQTIRRMSERIADSITRFTTVERVPVTDYVPGLQMVDLEKIPAPEAGRAGPDPDSER